MNGLDIDVSYKHPLNQATKIEFGYDGRLNNNTETMDFQLTDSNNNTFLGVNTFRYKRDIHSFFIETRASASKKRAGLKNNPILVNLEVTLTTSFLLRSEILMNKPVPKRELQ